MKQTIETKSNKRKGVAVILMTLCVLTASLAFFTDHKKNTLEAGMGSLGINVEVTADAMDNLAPGDNNDLSFKVTNNGTLDGIVRHTYIITSTAPFKDQDVTLTNVTTGDAIAKVNEAFTGASFNLKAKESVTHDMKLNLKASVGNDLQLANFTVEVLTEIAQERNNETPDWVTLSSETITFGGGDHAVVPGV